MIIDIRRIKRSEVVPDRDLERIAALIDGVLAGPERSETLRLMAESGAAYDVYADSVSCLHGLGAVLELEPAGGHARRSLAPALSAHSPSPRRPDTEPRNGTPRLEWSRPRWWTVLPLAAALAGVLLIRPAAPGPEAFEARTLVSTLQLAASPPRFDASLDVQVMPVYRGEGVPGTLEGRSFRLGVNAVRMEAYASVERMMEARRSAEAMLRLLDGLDATPALLVQYRTISDGFGLGGHPVGVEGRATADEGLERWLASRSSAAQARYRLGKGAEAARIAVAAGDLAYLHSHQGRAFLHLADQARLPTTGVEAMTQLRSLVRTDLDHGAEPAMVAALVSLMVDAAY